MGLKLKTDKFRGGIRPAKHVGFFFLDLNINIKFGATFQKVCEKLIMKFSWPKLGLKDNSGI